MMLTMMLWMLHDDYYLSLDSIVRAAISVVPCRSFWRTETVVDIAVAAVVAADVYCVETVPYHPPAM